MMENASESSGNLPPKRERSKEFKPSEVLGPLEEHFRIVSSANLESFFIHIYKNSVF